MRAFSAIVLLTIRSAVRSRTLQALTLLLAAWAVLIPYTVTGSDVMEFARMTLLYSLSGITAILGMAALWLGCLALSSDIEDKRAHMVATKPVPRIAIFCAKWAGVFTVALTLLIVSTAAVYATMMYRISRDEFSETDKARLRDEVLVSRKSFYPRRADYARRAEEIMRESANKRIARGLPEENDLNATIRTRRQALSKAMSEDSAMDFQRVRLWFYDGLEPDTKGSMFIRTRVFANSLSRETQQQTRILLGFAMVRKSEDGKSEQAYIIPLSDVPEQLTGGAVFERKIPNGGMAVTSDGRLALAVINCDPNKETLYIQPGDGPIVMIPAGGFLRNYLRATLCMAVALLTLSGLGCAFGAVLSTPTAIFMAVSYVLLGCLATFVSSQDFYENDFGVVGHHVGNGVLKVVIDLSEFDQTERLARGELIEWKTIGDLSGRNFALRALPLVALCALLYRRRELAGDVQ
ncbi:MAG: hypothetical protein MJ025_02600 [Victivallaceae bacterium]|nr:hypothetical protein [Victivallaceae bacterium]